MRRYSRDELERLGRVDRWWMIVIYVFAALHLTAQVNPIVVLIAALAAIACGIVWMNVNGKSHSLTLGRYALATSFACTITTIDNIHAGLLLFK